MSDLTTNLTELRQYIHADVPKCPLVIMDQAILEAVEQFFDQTQAWQITLDLFNLREDIADYDLDGWPTYARMGKVVEVQINDITKSPGSDYYLSESDVLTLVTAPGADDDNALEVTVSLLPATDATKVPQDLYNLYYRYWVHGAKYLIMAQVGKPWSNPAMAAHYLNMWEADMSNAKAALRRGQINRPLRAIPRNIVI